MDQRRDNVTFLGVGTYTVAEARRLAEIPGSRISRWLRGGSRRYAGERVFDPPLWIPELPDIDGAMHLTFRDLIELRMVDRFRRQGLSLPYVRKVVRIAQALVEDTHPFTSNAFKTDGRKLYLEVVSGTDEPKLIEVLEGQHAFHSIIAVGLRDIVFENGAAIKWLPQSGRGDVVIDPTRSFGQPILNASGVPTSILKLQIDAGRTAREVSRDFEIDERAVRSALAFETKLAA